jgi:hypothetical protein
MYQNGCYASYFIHRTESVKSPPGPGWQQLAQWQIYARILNARGARCRRRPGPRLPGPGHAPRQGDIIAVRVLSVVPGDVPDTGAAAVRQAVIQQAVERSEALDIARLALTVDVKWGFLRPRRHPIRRRGVARPRRDLHVDALKRAPVDAG